MGVLLLGGNYYGTLAAAREFGRRGIPVTVADESTRTRTHTSRFVADTAVHPPLSDVEALLDWLVAWGTAHPGTMLYPTNDHLAWIFAAHRERLGEVFAMHSPSADAVMALLDKQRLHEACSHPDVGIDVPATQTLGDAGASSAAVDGVSFPVLLKPRTQVLLKSGIKGFLIADQASLAEGLERFRKLVAFEECLTRQYPDIAEPMVQEYLAAAETRILSISGYISPDGRIAARAAQKVLQRPRKLGIGLCFEGREPDPALVGKIAALARRVGYFGTFEAEFILDGSRQLLIDFNPRFYSQMAFDIARGMSLPMLVWHAARGEEAEYLRHLSLASASAGDARAAYCHKGMLDLVLVLQRLSGRMSREDVRRWRQWYTDRRAQMTDAVRDPDDPRPARIDTRQWVRSFAGHPRHFVRSFVLNDA